MILFLKKLFKKKTTNKQNIGYISVIKLKVNRQFFVIKLTFTVIKCF